MLRGHWGVFSKSSSSLKRPVYVSSNTVRRSSNTTVDHRNRLSRVWAPSGGIAETSVDDAHAKLIRAGFLRQAHSGIFHMLPLGRRVLDKLEKLIDKHMANLNASKLALSSISSAELWSRSGRLAGSESELFHFKDRKEVPYILAPTHEEEITSLVSSTVRSYREFPVRLYQTTRKYRDELRPRHGVLRSREFVMKDLYTFDISAARALLTYHEVRNVYTQLFDELKIPYLVAEADSGDMGGNLSHEFHFPTVMGEDNVISCNSCDYVANEELADIPITSKSETAIGEADPTGFKVWRGISRDRKVLVNAWLPSTTAAYQGTMVETEINIYALKKLVPSLDASVKEAINFWPGGDTTLSKATQEDATVKPQQLINIVDGRLPENFMEQLKASNRQDEIWPSFTSDAIRSIPASTISNDQSTGGRLNLVRIRNGDSCSRCDDGELKVQEAIELGHTFYLGTRYSVPLDANVSVPVEHLEASDDSKIDLKNNKSTENKIVPMQMGCHGIGVSRMMGAVADTLSDDKGLNWPRVMAPYEVVVVPGKGLGNEAIQVYDELSDQLLDAEDVLGPKLDVILDDRTASMPWKMRDADQIGYPVLLVVGRGWKDKKVEVQARRLKVREEVSYSELLPFIRSLLSRL